MALSEQRKEYLYDYQKSKGESVNGYIKKAIDQRFESDNTAQEGA